MSKGIGRVLYLFIMLLNVFLVVSNRDQKQPLQICLLYTIFHHRPPAPCWDPGGHWPGRWPWPGEEYGRGWRAHCFGQHCGLGPGGKHVHLGPGFDGAGVFPEEEGDKVGGTH